MYQLKKESYFNIPRIDLIGLIPKKENNKVLEIGAGSGDTLIELKKTKIASEVVGIELMQLPDSNQNHPDIDKFIFGNIENIELDLPENYFDVIICGDVLEHLIDPWNTLHKLHKFLKSDGIIIISLPNFREFQTLYKIFIKADFHYTEEGILDKTHLRFFCKKNIISLLNQSSFKIISLHSKFDLYKVANKRKTVNKLTFGLFRDLLTIQYIVVATKNQNNI